jgi:hypothetical protein
MTFFQDFHVLKNVELGLRWRAGYHILGGSSWAPTCLEQLGWLVTERLTNIVYMSKLKNDGSFSDS